jgi:hypothetical protein
LAEAITGVSHGTLVQIARISICPDGLSSTTAARRLMRSLAGARGG